MHHDFRLYAHRGCPAELPENTLPAFQRAVELGVDALEMDVHLTRDGHPLVSHDPDAARMGGRPAAWRDLESAGGARPETDVEGELLKSQLQRQQLDKAVDAQLEHLKRKLGKDGT